MRKMNKRTVAALAGLATLGVVAGAFALFNTSFEVENVFKVDNSADARFEENFDAPPAGDDLFGGTYSKSGKVINKGTVAVKARVNVTASWDNNVSNEYMYQDTNGTEKTGYAATLHFGDTAKNVGDFSTSVFHADADADVTNAQWTYDDTDKYFYYTATNGVIGANVTTGNLMKSVEFNGDITKKTSSNKYYVTAELKDNPTTATEYQDQKAAKAAALTYTGTTATDKSITVKTVETYNLKDSADKAIYETYKGKTLTVTLTGQIMDANMTDWPTPTP